MSLSVRTVRTSVMSPCPHTGVKDLPELVNELHEVFPKWFTLGLNLGVSYPRLQEIETNYSKDQSRCVIEILAEWLKENSTASRSDLARALRAPAIGHKNVAARIDQ